MPMLSVFYIAIYSDASVSVMKNNVGEHVIIVVNVNDTTVATHSD